MAIVLSGTTNDITINGASVATDAEVSSAVAPLATTAYVASAVAPKANTADLKEIGVGQTWQSFTVGTQRIADTTYTNTTGKPIEVIVSSYGGTNNDILVYLDSGVGFRIGIGNVNTGNALCAGSVIIPSASTYKITSVGALQSWTELR